MENTAAVYKYINDQTLHYINLGYTSAEISNMLELPDELNKVWYMRQYYGTLSHNIKAVYQKYMGWYTANPVDLNPLPDEKFYIVRKAGVLLVYEGSTDDDAECSVTCTKAQFAGLMAGNSDAMKDAKIKGDESVPGRLVKYMVKFTMDFNIIEP